MKTSRLPFWPVMLIAVVVSNPVRVLATGMPQVYAGPATSASFLVDGSGALNAWGKNDSGQLGIGGYADQPNPASVPFPAGVHSWRTMATANGNGSWTYAIGSDLQLYAAGFVSFSTPSYLYMTPITPPAGVGGWSAVAASELGWLAVSTNGPIYGSINGSITWPPQPGATHWTQVAVCSSSSGPGDLNLFAMDNRGKLFGVNYSTAYLFVEIPIPAGATAWTNITAGGRFMLALANDGNLYGWGHNEAGQLGLGFTFAYTNTPQRIALPAGKTGWKAVSAGGIHTMAITTDGQLFVWGNNFYGQLGLGDNSQNRVTPTAVPNLTNIVAVAAGCYHSLVVSDCQVLAWGRNVDGQLGAGFTSPFYPLPISSQFTYNICSTNPPLLPLVSIIAADPKASEGTWQSSATNTGRFEISRAVATASSLVVNFSVGGTASNGVDY
ncbi:MAG: hypothetical protein HOP33_02460, partial [Verrucomicrobia bacterium]|nr:hypothetical protein [Verrucomicrobiota bacterium]